MATCANDALVRVFDPVSMEIYNTLEANDWIFDLNFHPTDQVIAVAHRDKKVSLWNFESGEVLAEFVT